MAGKGDKPRPCDIDKYKRNYDRINWAKKENRNANRKHMEADSRKSDTASDRRKSKHEQEGT